MQPEVRLLGPGGVRDGGGVVDAASWRTAKTFDLLRVLALSPGRPVPTEVLLDMFWPTAGAERGGSSLRTAACQLRKVLGNESVVRAGNGLMLQGTWVDVDAYRALAARVDEARADGRPAQVLALVSEAEELYAGDLDVAGTDCPVLHEAHAELRDLRVHLLLEGAEAAGRCADWRRSLAFAQRTAALETSDRSTRALMRAWFAVGETAKPVEEFERLRRHLADEYGVDPAPQTRALYLEVVGACAEWPPRETTVGREDEIRQVVEAVTGWLIDPDGPSGVVWLVGEPGSGRETVAREAARTLMLPMVEGAAGPGAGATVELLPDQGALTRGLAAVLGLRAATWRRVLLAPVAEVSPGALGEGDAVIDIPPLARADFHRLMALVLQCSPSERLDDELFEESRGLPGRACRAARRRLEAGDLTWSPRGVDTARKATLRTRVLPAVAAIPFVLFGCLGSELVSDPAVGRTAAVAERGVLAGAGAG